MRDLVQDVANGDFDRMDVYTAKLDALDAQLQQITLSGIWSDGLLDVRGLPAPPIHVVFRGPNEDVTVMVYEHQLTATTGPRMLGGTPLPTLGCTLAEVATIAKRQRLGVGATMYFMSTLNEPPFVRLIDSDARIVTLEPTTCKLVSPR